MVYDIEHTIKRLRNYHSSSFPIISVYLSIPKDAQPYATHDLFVALAATSLSKIDQETFSQDIAYIDGYLAQFKNREKYKSIAFFSGGNKLWEVVPMHHDVQTFITINHSPYLEPIIEHLDANKRYLVVLTDREKAKFITLYHGAVEEEEIIDDPSIPQVVKVNEERFYGRTDKISRHINDHLNRHFDTVADKLKSFVNNKPIAGVVVGGHKRYLTTFEKHMPKPLQERILGEIITVPDAPVNDVVEMSKKVLSKRVHQPLS